MRQITQEIKLIIKKMAEERMPMAKAQDILDYRKVLEDRWRKEQLEVVVEEQE